MFQSQVLLPNMSGKIDYIGDAVKAVAYNSHNTSKRTNTKWFKKRLFDKNKKT